MKLRTLFCSTLVCSLALVADRAGGGAGPADSASDIPYLRKQGTANGLEARLLYAFGRHDAIGVSPMEIERPAAPDIELTSSYDVIKQLAPLISEHQGNGTMSAVLMNANDPAQKVAVGSYTLTVAPSRPRGATAATPAGPGATPLAALFIANQPDEYFILGNGLTITFASNTPGAPLAGMGTVEEGTFVKGQWVPGRWLAGDDTEQGDYLFLRNMGILRVTVYRYR